MNARRTALAAGTLTLLAGGLMWLSGSPAESLWSSGVLPDAGLDEDVRLEYTLRYTGNSTVHIPGGALTSTIAIDGRLAIEHVRPIDADSTMLAAEMIALDAAQLQIGEQALRPDLLGARTMMAVHDSGRIEALYFPADAPVLTRQLMQAVLLDLQVIRDDAQTYEVEQDDNNGVLMGAWERTGARALTRHPARYVSLRGFGSSARQSTTGALTVSLHPDGYVETLDATQTLTLTDDGAPLATIQGEIHQSLSRVSRRSGGRQANPLADAGWDAQAPDAEPGRELAAQNALRDRVGTMSWAQMEDLLRSGAVADIEELMWRGTGLLEQNPALAARLGQLHDELAGLGRELAVDLLANADCPDCQAALRDLLARPVNQAAPDFGRAVQAVVMMPSPEAETVDFLRKLSAQHEGQRRRIVQNAAALTARRLAAQGDDGPARTLGAELADEIKRTEDPDARAELLIGLGNLGLEEHVGVALESALDDDPGVRSAAARALRDIPTAEATDGLIGLATDPDPIVQAQAARSMVGRDFSTDDVTTLADEIALGAVGEDADEYILRIARDHRDGDLLLQAMLERGVESDQIRGLIEAALRAG
ncbi:MAG: HEAT repeat domain-containing protein [Myxococcota bacterium]